jgi:hypothetical protein
MLRGLVEWVFMVVGIVCGVYGVIQLFVGVVRAVFGPELHASLGVAFGGTVVFVIGALILWSGRWMGRTGRP